MRPRVIPALLLSGAGLVKTRRFADPVYVGDPINAVRIFNQKEVDELILLDIDASRQRRCPDFSLLEEIAAGTENLVIAKLNVDENPQTAASYGITSIPTMSVFQGGQIVKTIIGAKPKAALMADLQPYL